MNLFAVSGILTGVTGLIEGLFVIAKGRRKIHFLWGIFCFSVMIWGTGVYKIAGILNANEALLWWRVAYVGVIFIPIFLLHFIFEFLDLPNKWLAYLVYLLGLFFLLTNFIDGLFIKNVDFVFDQFYYLSSPPPIYIAFVGVFFAIVVCVLFMLLRAYKSAHGTKRVQLKYLFWALLIGFGGGGTAFLPVFKIYFYPALNATISIGILVVAYAILRYRFMDIRIVVRKVVIYSLSAAFVYGMFYFVAWIYNQFFGSIYAKNAYISGFAVAPLFVLLFVWLNEKIRRITSKYLFSSLYSSQETMAKLTDELTNSIDLNKITASITKSVKDAMQTDRADVLLPGENGNLPMEYFQKNHRPIVADEAQLQNSSSGEMSRVLEYMKKSELSLCLPMIISNKLIGIIVLGSKISGDAYTSEDLTLLNTLSKQAAIAVDNARLYHEVKDFNKTLQQKVDEQTKEIKKAFELEKHANEELKLLDKNKTEFMMVTQHHLRTPLSVNSGFIDLILNGTYGKISAKVKDVLVRLQDSTRKEIDVVNELLDVSSYQLGKQIMNLDKMIDVEALMDETLKDLKVEAENKGIYLKYENQGKIPQIPADATKLKLALTNVIDNCVKYTKQGGVSVSLSADEKNNKVKITVKDTGIGLSKDVLHNIFKQTFQRSQEAESMFCTGKGLGLFLTAKIIEGHHGKIWAESEGEGKGSAFYIELPTKHA